MAGLWDLNILTMLSVPKVILLFKSLKSISAADAASIIKIIGISRRKR